MSLHASNRTAPNRAGEQRQTPQTTPVAGAYPVVVSSVHDLISAQAENDRQQLLVFNPSRDRDSIAEHAAALLRADVDPAAVAADLLALLRELLESEQREREHERDAIGPLDLLARTLAVQPDRQGLGVKRAAARLRAPLKIIKRAQTEMVPASEYVPAVRQIDRVIAALPVATLRGASMRNALNGPSKTGPHDVLLSLLTDGGQTEAER